MSRRGVGVVQHVRCTRRSDGDFHLDHVDPFVLDGRRRDVVDLPWTMLDEVHGTEVVLVDRPGAHDRARGDGAVTSLVDTALAVWVGDCAPVVLCSDGGAIGVVHAGWRGLRDGIVAEGVAQVRALRPGAVHAVLGPCIEPCCYEFAPQDLASFVDRWGSNVVGVTSDGRTALDMPAAVTAALHEVDVSVERIGGCTGCHAEEYWSHRARRELGRQAMVVWQTVEEPSCR